MRQGSQGIARITKGQRTSRRNTAERRRAQTTDQQTDQHEQTETTLQTTDKIGATQ
jgi:hypothetical protein